MILRIALIVAPIVRILDPGSRSTRNIVFKHVWPATYKVMPVVHVTIFFDNFVGTMTFVLSGSIIVPKYQGDGTPNVNTTVYLSGAVTDAILAKLVSLYKLAL